MLREIEQHADIAVIGLDVSVLDASNITEFKNEIAPFLKDHSNMILDLSNVTFMDSSGLGALLSCLRQLNKGGGDLRLCSVNKPVRALLELVRMHKIVGINNDQTEAIRAFET